MYPWHRWRWRALIPSLIALGGLWLQNAVATIISFASVGIYMGFSDAGARGVDRKIEGLDTDRSLHARPLGMAGESHRIRLRGERHRQHDVALAPRSAGSPWYSNYGMIVTAVGVIVLGAVYMITAKPYERGNAPAGRCASIEGGYRRRRHRPPRRLEKIVPAADPPARGGFYWLSHRLSATVVPPRRRRQHTDIKKVSGNGATANTTTATTAGAIPAAAPGKNELSRSLKGRHLTMISIGGIIGAGLFVSSSTAIIAAGPASFVSYAICGFSDICW